MFGHRFVAKLVLRPRVNRGLAICCNTSGQVAITHPLEPLSKKEVSAAVSLLKDNKFLSPTTRVISIYLKEPAKELVYNWKVDKSTALPREAYVSLHDNSTNSAQAVHLNLSEKSVVATKPAPKGAQPTISVDEMDEAEAVVLNDPTFKSLIKKHYGIDDVSLVMVDIWSVGHYGSRESEENRMARPLCFLRADPTDNGYARPIEGIRPVVDLNKMEVMRVEEFDIWPLPPNPGNYASDRVPNQRTDIKPLVISQPKGPSFQLTGNVMEWQKWKFVIGFNAREGLTIHDVSYTDKGKDRSILYRASLTEMVVPYGDPSPTQRRKNAFDVGEYGIGMCTNSLQFGCDCVGHIQYIDGEVVTSRGKNLTIPNAICIHEEDYGILWKHTDRRFANKPEVRRSRRLVVSAVATVENYEYGYFWYFYQDGNIEFEVKLTGSLSLGVYPKDDSQPKKPKYGTMISPRLYAPIHQHFFNMRLDFAIDQQKNGQEIFNTAQVVDVVQEPDGNPENQFENAFYAETTSLKTEKRARMNMCFEKMRTWKVVNPKVTNHVGDPVGYKLMPGENSMPVSSPNACWRKRAKFVDNHFWVTPFEESELFAAGDYPNQSVGDKMIDGLDHWTNQDRNIEGKDLVVWYSFGHTHVPRTEDYPIMPTAYAGFLLKPSGFFDENPANDVPPEKKI